MRQLCESEVRLLEQQGRARCCAPATNVRRFQHRMAMPADAKACATRAPVIPPPTPRRRWCIRRLAYRWSARAVSGSQRGRPSRNSRCGVLNDGTPTKAGAATMRQRRQARPRVRNAPTPPSSRADVIRLRAVAIRQAQSYVAVRREARPMTRAIPGPLGGVPAHRASHVRADGGAQGDRARRVAIRCDLGALSIDDLSLTASDRTEGILPRLRQTNRESGSRGSRRSPLR